MSDLQPSRALDRQVAEAMGWRVVTVPCPKGQLVRVCCVALADADGTPFECAAVTWGNDAAWESCPTFSTDLHAAVDYLLPWLQAQCDVLRVETGQTALQLHGWLIDWECDHQAHSTWQPTLPLALCAAVLAVTQEKQQGVIA